MAIQVKTMQKHLAAMLLPARLGAMAFTLFAGLALALAVLGVYGVVSYAVARRTREVGIRLAVGAQPSGARAVADARRIRARRDRSGGRSRARRRRARGCSATLLFGVGRRDPVTFIGAPLLLMWSGAVAAFLPARRASRVDPASVLRAE